MAAGSHLRSPASMVVASSAIDSAYPSRPMRMTLRRPATSLRRPHIGLTNTQMDADVAKIVDTWDGEIPMARAAGGRIEKSIDCPIPIHTRQTNSSRKARVCDGGAPEL